jgi:hypothetical protein
MIQKAVHLLPALFISLTCFSNSFFAQNSPIDNSTARQYFQEAEAACDKDDGRLWGVRVCGPMIFVEPVTRQVAANQPDADGLLVKQGDIYVGKFPSKQPVANAPMTWSGVKWAMIVWSFLTNDKFQRVKVMTHESFHRIQNDLKFPLPGVLNNHLDSKDGRVWLQLEWRALRQALASEGKARRQAVEDALIFRSYRHSLFSGSNETERALIMHEGLAEYTGFKMTAETDAQLIEYLVKQIEKAVERPSFIGGFAYSSGPAYGVLLDGTTKANWIKNLTAKDDLGLLLQKSLKIKLPTDLKAKAEKQSAKYDGAALIAAETEREAAHQKKITEYRKRLVDENTLLITLTDQRSVSINTTNIFSLEGVGTVYLTARVTDDWGILEVSNGALMIHEPGGRISKIYVSAPTDPNLQTLKGDGWTLQLSPDWRLVPAQRKGDYFLKKVEK